MGKKEKQKKDKQFTKILDEMKFMQKSAKKGSKDAEKEIGVNCSTKNSTNYP